MFLPEGFWASCWRSLLTGGPSIPSPVTWAISLEELVALSHPGHRMPHSETSRQLRRCRGGEALNEDVSSKRAVFNAIWSIYRLMAAPAPSRPQDKKRLYTNSTQYTLANTQALHCEQKTCYTYNHTLTLSHSPYHCPSLVCYIYYLNPWEISNPKKTVTELEKETNNLFWLTRERFIVLMMRCCLAMRSSLFGRKFRASDTLLCFI